MNFVNTFLIMYLDIIKERNVLNNLKPILLENDYTTPSDKYKNATSVF